MRGGGHLTKQAAGHGDGQLTQELAREWIVADLGPLQVEAERVYQKGLKIGIPKEVSRVALTLSRYSKMRATGNLRGWLALLSLRLDPAAQWEFQEYAEAVGWIVAANFPRTWELFEEGLKPKARERFVDPPGFGRWGMKVNKGTASLLKVTK